MVNSLDKEEEINLFITTNTIPRVTRELAKYPDTFKILDITPMIKNKI